MFNFCLQKIGVTRTESSEVSSVFLLIYSFKKYMHPSPQTGADAGTMSKGGGAAEAASARATALPWCLPGLPVGVGESERAQTERVEVEVMEKYAKDREI